MARVNISEVIRNARQRAAREQLELLGGRLPVCGKRKPRHEESEIQRSCIRWFRYAYPKYLCFAVPNGGSRNAIEAANMKKEGVMAGVSDLIIVADHKVLFVELKTPKGRQQQTQKDFQKKVEALGFKYVICRSLDEFMREVNAWLGKKMLKI